MKIALVPMRMDGRLELAVKGETLVLNGAAVDLSAATAKMPLVPETELPWILGEVVRVAGALQVTLLLPQGADAPEETRFPADLLIARDGPVTLPPYECAVEAEAAEIGDPPG